MPKVHSKEFPWFSPSDLNRRSHAVEAAKLMMNAAHTAPTTGGVDHMEAELVWGEEEQTEIAEKMEEISHRPENERTGEMYRTEAIMAREADCILLLGDIRPGDALDRAAIDRLRDAQILQGRVTRKMEEFLGGIQRVLDGYVFNRLGPQAGYLFLSSTIFFSNSEGILWGIRFGARLRSCNAPSPPSRYRLTHFWTVFLVVR